LPAGNFGILGKHFTLEDLLSPFAIFIFFQHPFAFLIYISFVKSAMLLAAHSLLLSWAGRHDLYLWPSVMALNSLKQRYLHFIAPTTMAKRAINNCGTNVLGSN